MFTLLVTVLLVVFWPATLLVVGVAALLGLGLVVDGTTLLLAGSVALVVFYQQCIAWRFKK